MPSSAVQRQAMHPPEDRSTACACAQAAPATDDPQHAARRKQEENDTSGTGPWGARVMVQGAVLSAPAFLIEGSSEAKRALASPGPGEHQQEQEQPCSRGDLPNGGPALRAE